MELPIGVETTLWKVAECADLLFFLHFSQQCAIRTRMTHIWNPNGPAFFTVIQMNHIQISIGVCCLIRIDTD